MVRTDREYQVAPTRAATAIKSLIKLSVFIAATSAHLEVNKEDDNAKVNKGVGSRDQVGLAVQHEDDRGHKASLGVAEK
jgi:hypothetical protein